MRSPSTKTLSLAVQVFHVVLVLAWIISAFVAPWRGGRYLQIHRVLNNAILSCQVAFLGCPLVQITSALDGTDYRIWGGSFTCWMFERLFHVRMPAWIVTAALAGSFLIGSAWQYRRIVR